MFETPLVPEPVVRLQNSVWKAAAPWWTYLEQHICVFRTGPQSANGPSVGVSLYWRRRLHDAWGSGHNLESDVCFTSCSLAMTSLYTFSCSSSNNTSIPRAIYTLLCHIYVETSPMKILHHLGVSYFNPNAPPTPLLCDCMNPL